MYFDDKQLLDPSFARGSGSRASRCIAQLIGIDFEDKKHEANDQKPVALGVSNDFSRTPITLTVTMEVTESRKDNVRDLITAVFKAGSITHSQAQRRRKGDKSMHASTQNECFPAQ